MTLDVSTRTYPEEITQLLRVVSLGAGVQSLRHGSNGGSRGVRP